MTSFLTLRMANLRRNGELEDTKTEQKEKHLRKKTSSLLDLETIIEEKVIAKK